jgi:hypothetical protein
MAEEIKIDEVVEETTENNEEVTEVKPEGFTTGEKVAIGVVGTGFVIGTVTVGKAVYKHGKSAAKAVGRGIKKGWNKLFGKKNEEVPEEEPEEEKKPKKASTKKKAAKKAAEEKTEM